MNLIRIIIFSLFFTPLMPVNALDETLDKIQIDIENSVNGRKNQSKHQVPEWRPSAKEFDWVQLTSGEWLKGEIKSMYNESLEFDSDKLDLLNIDFEDVKYLQSVQPSLVKVENIDSISGKLNITENKVSVGEGLDKKIFARSDLISFTPGGNSEFDLWSIKLSLGLDLKGGNTNQMDYTSKISLKRRTAKSRFLADYIGNISKTSAGDDELKETVRNQRTTAKSDIYVTRYFFYTPLSLEYVQDKFQNIDGKYSVGVGIGYTIMDKNRTDWSISGGPIYLSTKYVSVEEGEDIKDTAISLSVGTIYDTEITSNVDFLFKYDIKFANKKIGGYSHNTAATIETELTGKLDFDVSAYWDRTSNPKTNKDGVVPEQNDYRLVIGLTYTY